MKPSDDLTLTIDHVAFGGKGVARLDGRVIFVPGTMTGETVRARIHQEHKDYDVARLIRVVEPHEDRIDPTCPLALRPNGIGPISDTFCQGCQYQHMSYEAECRLKTEQLKEVLGHKTEQAGEVVADIIPSPNDTGYRNKIRLTASNDRGNITFGYIHEDSHEIIDLDACPLANQAVNTLLTELREKPGFLHSLRDRTTVTLRNANEQTVFWRDKPGKKLSWLKESTSLGPLSVPAGSFFQINPGAAEKLIATVKERITESPAQFVLDLYCGAGVFALLAAQSGKQAVMGVDLDEQVIEAAKYNAKSLNLDVEFRAMDAKTAMKAFLGRTPEDLILILDPPRSGLHPDERARIAQHRPSEIIYVSCAPDTLARDLQDLEAADYTINSVQPIDMFPRTKHFETVTHLTRNA